MQVSDFLSEAVANLTGAGIGTARLDALVLLENCTEHNRAWLLAHPEFELSSEQVEKLNTQIEKRALHTPLAYIRGKTEFYGREFIINDYVLEPRPESETMIDLLKSLTPTDSETIVDVGSGSGALAVTAKLEIPGSEVLAIDIDPNCVDLTRKNAKKLKANIKVMQGNLLEPLTTFETPLSVLLCNLPYVPDSFQINQAATHEPRLAIFGGTDGLDAYRKLFTQIATMNLDPRCIITEAMPPQHIPLAEIAASHNYVQKTSQDFIQVFLAGSRSG